MEKIDYNKHIKINPGDEIVLVKYYDHAQTKESLEEIRKKPLLLWCVGKIVNKHTNDPFYCLINTGAIGRFKKPLWRDIIMKNCIKSIDVIFTIPKSFDQE